MTISDSDSVTASDSVTPSNADEICHVVAWCRAGSRGILRPMTSRELIRWSRLHERRARKLPALAIPVIAGGLLAAWVGWRSTAGFAAASHAWLAGAVVAYAVAFLRVPFHIYWRADAPLLAQLPIEGRPLFDAALLRCVGAAAATTIAVVIGAAPLVLDPDGPGLAIRHAVFAATLGIAAGLLLPAVTVGAASLVVHGRGDRALRAATALGGAPARARGPGRGAAGFVARGDPRRAARGSRPRS